MSELSEKNFGLLIAYLLPGFVVLWGASHFSATVESWIRPPSQGVPTLAGFGYATLASLAAGLTVSAIRWALIDQAHHATGIRPPAWDFARLEDRLHGFQALVENHYRFYQHYSGMLLAIAFAYRAHLFATNQDAWSAGWISVGFVVLELFLWAAARDALRKYYARAGRLLRA